MDKSVRTTTEKWKSDDVEDVEVLDDNPAMDQIDVQFGDGTVVFGMPRDCFEIEAD